MLCRQAGIQTCDPLTCNQTELLGWASVVVIHLVVNDFCLGLLYCYKIEGFTGLLVLFFFSLEF